MAKEPEPESIGRYVVYCFSLGCFANAMPDEVGKWVFVWIAAITTYQPVTQACDRWMQKRGWL